MLENETMILCGEPVWLELLNERAAAVSAQIHLLTLTIVAVLLQVLGLTVAAVRDGGPFLLWVLRYRQCVNITPRPYTMEYG